MKGFGAWRAWVGVFLAFVLTGSALAAAPRGPNGFPSHPITIVVTFPPGGGTDLLARKFGAALSTRLGVPVIIENRPGASGNIAATYVAHGNADGYTLLMVNSTYAINPAVYHELAFDPLRDLRAVIAVAYVPSVLVTQPGSSLHSLDDVLRAGTATHALPFASCGNGTPQHLAGEMLALGKHASMMQVPYRGCGPALTDVVAGHVPLGIVTVSSAAAFIDAGQLRALAVTSATRSPILPTVDTVAHRASLPGYAITEWQGVLAPTGVPTGIVNFLNAQLAAIANEPDMRHALLALDFDPVATTPPQFQSLIKHDVDMYGKLAREIGLHVN